MFSECRMLAGGDGLWVAAPSLEVRGVDASTRVSVSIGVRFDRTSRMLHRGAASSLARKGPDRGSAGDTRQFPLSHTRDMHGHPHAV